MKLWETPPISSGYSLCPLWRLRATPPQSPMTSCPLPSGVSAPFPADLFQNVSFSAGLCCLFYRSLSLCCERLRLLVMEVNLTNLWISSISLVLDFFPFFLHISSSFSVPSFFSSPVLFVLFDWLTLWRVLQAFFKVHHEPAVTPLTPDLRYFVWYWVDIAFVLMTH